MSKNTVRVFFLCFLVFLITCSRITPTNKQWLVENLHGEFAISRSYLDDYQSLSARERILLYYLSRAAIAGRDIYVDQRHHDALRVRNYVEALLSDKNFSGELKNKILDYAKYLWINNSQYHARTGRKFIPRFTLQDVWGVVDQAESEFALNDAVFNQSFEPVVTNLTPKPDEGDIVQASATHIYDRGLSLKDIESLPDFWKSKVNVRFARVDGNVVPQVYKVGGVYGEELARVCYFLKAALPYTEGLQKSGLEKLIAFYESGDEEKFKQASIDWLKVLPRVDTINGFIESYMDPRQMIGGWEGVAYYTATDPVLSAFSQNVQYFEDHMPWNEAYKRKNITSKPVATLINVAMAVGEAGPVTWSGINLPNYADIRTTHGSKNVVLVNMIEARNQVTGDMMIREFYLPEYQDLMHKYQSKARRLLVYMHEVIGHGSGSADAALTSDPRNYIGKNYGAWEEARASLVAYHFITDSKLVEMGAFTADEQKDIVTALFLLELEGQLITLRNAKGEDVLREAHDRADQLIFEYLRQKTTGFEVVNVADKFYVKIRDVNALHQGSSGLLKIIHEAKAKGDKHTVDQFMEMYGNSFNKEWRDNIMARAEAIQLPEYVAMIFPKQIPVFDKDGKIVDVKIDNTESFENQHLRFGKISKTTEVSKEVY